MSALYLIRVPLTINALARWAGERGWLTGRAVAFDEGRALHHLVDEAFGPGALRPFRLLVPPRSGDGNLYSYSSQGPRGTAVCVAALRVAGPPLGPAGAATGKQGDAR